MPSRLGKLVNPQSMYVFAFVYMCVCVCACVCQCLYYKTHRYKQACTVKANYTYQSRSFFNCCQTFRAATSLLLLTLAALRAVLMPLPLASLSVG